MTMPPVDLFRRRATLALAASVLNPVSAMAKTSTPLRVIVTTGPGSSVDNAARALSPGLSLALGQPVFIENQPAAGGVSGTRTVVQAAPDGNTIGMVSNSHASNPVVYKDIPFDAINDVTAITVLSQAELLLVVNPKKLPVTNLAELTAALKARPKAYNHGSSGNGTGLHLAAEMYLDQAGVSSTHVPYKGAGPFLNDLIGGQVDWGCFALAPVLGSIKAGSLRVIAVLAKKRTPELPAVATSVEQGMTGLIFPSWIAVIGPAKLPQAEVERLYNAFVSVSAGQEVRTALQKAGTTLNPMAPKASAAFIRAEYERFVALSKKINLKVD